MLMHALSGSLRVRHLSTIYNQSRSEASGRLGEQRADD
jgi:hypothetical protein